MASSPLPKAARLIARMFAAPTAKRRPTGAGNVSLDNALTVLAQRWVAGVGEDALAQRVYVAWNARLQTTAGTACTKAWCIEINPAIREFGVGQLHRTVRHEAAHLVAHWRAGRRRIQTHGPEWRHACDELGISGEPAFHELPLARRIVQRKYAYQCRHCELVVYRVKRFGPYTACYKCCQRFTGGKYSAAYMFVKLGADHPIPLRTGK